MYEQDWSHCYRILELDADAAWAEVRAAYRTQIRLWHPDRVADRPEAKRLADEKSKAINNAYDRLATYYKAHGNLPHATVASVTVLSPASVQTHASPDHGPDWFTDTPGSGAVATNSWHFTFAVKLAVIAAIALIVYLGYSDTVSYGPLPDSSVVPNGVPDSALNTKSAPPPPHQTQHPRFTIGSTIGEVYSAQGTPSRTENNLWHYGASRIHFSEGRVVSWEESPENLLNPGLDPQFNAAAPHFIALGSSKPEVRAIQGDPVRETPSTWEYGTSRIYFKNDLVIGWDESPLYLLRVRR